MRAHWYSSLTNVLLLSFSLCITELMTNSFSICESEVETPRTCTTTYDNGFDVLNPLYIFK